MGRLDGKVAVITGAGGGMGREAALLFCAEGARVCVADVDADAAEQTASEASDAFPVEVDVADENSVRAMYEQTAERYGGIDVLYNNAGISPSDDASILETESDAWQRVQDVNTKGVYFCCKYGIPHLLERVPRDRPPDRARHLGEHQFARDEVCIGKEGAECRALRLGAHQLHERRRVGVEKRQLSACRGSRPARD